MFDEVIELSDMLYIDIALSEELKILLNNRVPVQLLMDSKSLLEITSKCLRTSEKRTMLDVAAARKRFI